MAVEFKGLDEFYKFTDKAGPNAEKALINALYEGGLKIENSAKSNTPVDTGRLRDSITTQSKDGGLTVEVGTNVEYAGFVHNGAQGRMPKPFLEQAWEQNKTTVLNEISKAIKEGID